jgi:mannose-1-phosphate guanylyltransferase / mannose-6-phosphate isomerase
MSGGIYPVILSGGSGTRLWPLSRDSLPKQLLSLVGDLSLLAVTAKRVSGERFARPIVICNERHQSSVGEQLAAIGVRPEATIIEPVGRNTAPAIAAAAALLRTRDPLAVMLVLPSDHIIVDEPAFTRAIAAAVKAAEAGHLVTFGITPTAPETGFGYIRRGAKLVDCKEAFEIVRFVEKPDPATALEYLADGAWSWNSGMFVFPVGLLLEELGRLEPGMVASAIASVDGATVEGEVVRLAEAQFAAITPKSIDYALMEHTPHAAVVPGSFGWSDIGSWRALWEMGEKDGAGNVIVGQVVSEDTQGCYLRSNGPLIAGLGLKDLIVVATNEVVLVAAKDRAQDVRVFANRLGVAEPKDA